MPAKFLFDTADNPPPNFTRPTHSIMTDSEDDHDDDAWGTTTYLRAHAIKSKSTTSLRMRVFGSASSYQSSRGRDRVKTISTAPGQLCAGETETEVDEPPRHLPTSRIIPSSGPLVPPNSLEQRFTPLLFEFSRLLSIAPAVIGTIYNLYHIFHPPTRIGAPERVDFAVSALWAILTGYQCLSLTTGLLTRWRLYYPPLPTLIRLLALQGICWPATQLTLSVLEHEKRPVVTWAVIATTTCVSRSLQIWVTSNLWWEPRGGEAEGGNNNGGKNGVVGTSSSSLSKRKEGYWKRWGGGKWGGRRWDWKEVGVKCALPAGIVYFVMAWAEQLRREFSSCKN